MKRYVVIACAEPDGRAGDGFAEVHEIELDHEPDARMTQFVYAYADRPTAEETAAMYRKVFGPADTSSKGR